jgi:hypothetical protein
MLLTGSSAPVSSTPFVDHDMPVMPTYESVMFLSDLKAAAGADQENMRSAPPCPCWRSLAALVQRRLEGHNSEQRRQVPP